MKLKPMEKLCKASGCVRLFDEAAKEPGMTPEEILRVLTKDMDEDRVPSPPRQWISDGVACYPLDGLPYLDEGCVCAIFDIDDKKRDKIVINHREYLPDGLSFADRLTTDQPLEEVRFRMSLGGDELALFRGEDGALVVIRAEYKKPLGNWKECEFFKRVSADGNVYVAVMSGCILRGLIGTYRISEQLVETLGVVYNAAGVAAGEQK